MCRGQTVPWLGYVSGRVSMYVFVEKRVKDGIFNMMPELDGSTMGEFRLYDHMVSHSRHFVHSSDVGYCSDSICTLSKKLSTLKTWTALLFVTSRNSRHQRTLYEDARVYKVGKMSSRQYKVTGCYPLSEHWV